MRSTRPLYCESVSRNPSPMEDAINSAATRKSHACASARRSPENDGGHDGRQLHGREQAPGAKPEGTAGLDELGVDMAQRSPRTVVKTGNAAPIAMRVIFGLFEEAQVDDEQRHPGERRDSAQSAQHGAQQLRGDPRQPDERTQREPDGRADREAEEDPLERDEDVGAQKPVLGELNPCEYDLFGRGQDHGGDVGEGRRRPPARDEDARQQQAQKDRGHPGSTREPVVRCPSRRREPEGVGPAEERGGTARGRCPLLARGTGGGGKAGDSAFVEAHAQPIELGSAAWTKSGWNSESRASSMSC